MMILLYISLFFMGVFIFRYIKDKRRISNGVILTIGLFFLLLYILTLLVRIADQNELIRVIVISLLILFLLLIPFFILAIGVSLVFNGRTMVKREGFKWANLLPLVVGIFIVGLLGAGLFEGSLFSGPIINILFELVLFIVSYFTFFLFIFLLSSFLYQFNFLPLKQDFIIVLGSGLIKGDRVSPLLASRLNRATGFYQKQLDKTGKQATIIVTGGQGPNETTSEANAMRLYLLEKGIPEDFILMEEKATTTFENMIFSKQLMDTISTTYRSIFVTNNFHLFRAGLYARKAGLKSDGIGSKTAFYYMPYALIREFVAVIFMYKWVHIILVSLMSVFFILVSIMSILLQEGVLQ